MLISLPRRALAALLIATAALACATTAGAANAAAPPTDLLPAAVQAQLARAQLPAGALSALVLPLPGGAPRLAWRADAASNPASVMKLVTTAAALELLGPAFTWQTPVYLDAPPSAGVLRGNVYLRGQGDPTLVMERLWLLLRRLRAQGVDAIDGDIVLDRSAFATMEHDAARFDGEPTRPYNAAPDALLVNYKALTLTLVPDRGAGVARVFADPPLLGVQLPASVPLAPDGNGCGDWRGGLRADFSQAERVLFAGSYPPACGERQWRVALADPEGYAARAIAGMWREIGGRLSGTVRSGLVPDGLKPVFSAESPPLSEVIRDINKFSNNVMTQQLFLTLGLQRAGEGSLAAARSVLAHWWSGRLGAQVPLVIDNGAGLSRDARLSARALALLLQQLWATPVMPELLSSLPIAGVDGTLRRRQGLAAAGQAHLKTGSLRDVAAIAGYVHGASGRRYVLVAIVNHANAVAARPALQALIDWTYED